ncbi:1-phosphofructokinase [Alicyclobacillus fastidiosus]|uniref:Tagatose-6-phosphate kinase n=2 Tax=Alicyclobacillus fastidiosus TaxID=392011 RepID=A0ABY6ZFP8_9BACL|nr:1-phosphofructokinase [Alicyclobacillus fastidiosus]WAH40940.1 1-phosphofructokinase [Alicyclobacillus fastidiosus]
MERQGVTEHESTKGRVITVTLNPAVDLFVSVKHLEPGTLHRVPTPLQHAGGKGLNVAKMLASLSVPTVATGFLGGRRGDWLHEALLSQGVDSKFVRIANESRMNVKVIDEAGTLTELNSPAPAFTDDEWRAFGDTLRTLCEPNSWLALCGNLPAGCPNHWYQNTISWAKQSDIKTLLDASGVALELGLKACPDVIKPNQHELEQLTGLTLHNLEEVMRAAAQLVDAGVGLVVVSLGEEGLAAVTSSAAIHVRVPSVPVVSSVGAGDTVVAGLLYGIFHRFSLYDTVRFAAAAGTAKVQKPGNMHPSQVDIETCLASTDIVDWRSKS